MSVLAIDIGNSRVGLNVFTDGKAQDPAIRIHHADLDKELATTLETLWEKAQLAKAKRATTKTPKSSLPPSSRS